MDDYADHRGDCGVRVLPLPLSLRCFEVRGKPEDTEASGEKPERGKYVSDVYHDKRGPRLLVKKYDREIGRKKRAITKYKEKIALLNKNFEKLSEVLFNRKNWALFLDSITDRAHVNDVELLEVTNKYVKGKANFGHVLEMGIRCKGKFQSILAFVNDLEQNKLVTDVYDSNIRYDLNSSNIVADLNVSVWGVNR